MGAYLIDHPPAVRQWYDERKRPLTGCTVLHTAEGVLDTVGPDTGAENTADFIRRRTTAGSYHDLVDSDTWVPLIPYRHGAFHDGTGSNNWALSISFACRTSDWRAMTGQKRDAFLRQGARAFAAQQAWRKANGYPLTELRLITKAQSDAGLSGFTYHGLRDPGRRSDPGVAAPNLFPLDAWLDHCRAALNGTAPTTQEDDMYSDTDRRIAADRHTQFANELTVQRGILAAVDGKVSGLAEAVRQLAGNEDLDLDKVTAAAEAGARTALAEHGAPAAG